MRTVIFANIVLCPLALLFTVPAAGIVYLCALVYAAHNYKPLRRLFVAYLRKIEVLEEQL